MSKLGIIFTGQGSQFEAMGKDIYDRFPESGEIYRLLSQREFDMAFSGNIEEISKTDVLQPIMIAMQLSIWQILKSRLFDNEDLCPEAKPKAVCGLSLGEYSALAASEIISFKDAIEVIRVRGKAMAMASENIESSMAAVMRMDAEAINDILKQVSTEEEKAYISNINSSKQTVIAGHKNAIEKAIKVISENGGKAIPLKVSGAFHTPYMAGAINELKNALNVCEFHEGKIAYFTNTNGKLYSGTDLADNLCNQMVNPVRLLDNIKNMASFGIDTFLEIGPGSVISNIIKKEIKEARVYDIGTAEKIDEFIELWSNEHGKSN